VQYVTYGPYLNGWGATDEDFHQVAAHQNRDNDVEFRQGSQHDASALRYNPQMRLKVREAFSSLEHLQQASVTISNQDICSILKNVVSLDLSRESGAKYVKHFLVRPGCARLSSTYAENRRVRYDAFAEDVWQALEKHELVTRSCGARVEYDPKREALPDSMLSDEIVVEPPQPVRAYPCV